MNHEADQFGDAMPQEDEFAEHLAGARPAPSAGFRRALHEHLSALDPGYGPRPERLWLIVAGYLALGLLLIGLGALLAL